MKLSEIKRIPWIFCYVLLLSALFTGCGLIPKSEKQEEHRVPVHKLDVTLRAIERDIGKAHKNLKGSITLALRVAPDGEIEEIKVKSNLLNEPQVEKDIMHMFENIFIDSISQEELRINVPLIFE